MAKKKLKDMPTYINRGGKRYFFHKTSPTKKPSLSTFKTIYVPFKGHRFGMKYVVYRSAQRVYKKKRRKR